MAKIVTHNQDKQKAFWGKDEFLSTAQNKSFSEMIFELISEKTPSKGQLKIFELILNLSIDHGSDTPSAQATIESAKQGKSLSNAVADGLSQINSSHGGAIEGAMEMFYKIKNSKLKIQDLVGEYLKEGRRIPGFGHRIYEVDPRAQLLLEDLKTEENGPEFIQIAKDVESQLLAQKGRKLPLNIDGAIALCLCVFGWEPKLGNAVFIIARTPGLCGQYLNNAN